MQESIEITKNTDVKWAEQIRTLCRYFKFGKGNLITINHKFRVNKLVLKQHCEYCFWLLYSL